MHPSEGVIFHEANCRAHPFPLSFNFGSHMSLGLLYFMLHKIPHIICGKKLCDTKDMISSRGVNIQQKTVLTLSTLHYQVKYLKLAVSSNVFFKRLQAERDTDLHKTCIKMINNKKSPAAVQNLSALLA